MNIRAETESLRLFFTHKRKIPRFRYAERQKKGRIL